MSDPVKQVAMRILDLREISDYTVDKMAEVLNVPVEEYRKYESGEVDMPISFLVMISMSTATWPIISLAARSSRCMWSWTRRTTRR